MDVLPFDSGIWSGDTVRTTLPSMGLMGRVPAVPSDPDTIKLVLFFDERSVAGHATEGGNRILVRGEWGPAALHQPLVKDIGELDLWSSGELIVHVILENADGRVADAWCWRDGRRLAGFWRLEGG